MRTPPPLAAAIREHIESHPTPRRRAIDSLAALFRLFTSERGQLPGRSYLDDAALRAAYLRYHLPLNVARASAVLETLARIFPALEALDTVVDLGAGPGSASLATLLGRGPSGPKRYLLSDRSAQALRLAAALIERTAALAGLDPPVVETTALRLPNLPPMPRRALVWLSMVINEIHSGVDERLAMGLFAALRRRLDAGSCVVIVEPALREPGLRLLRLRERLLETGAWRVLAPCTHERACPLLAERGRPWCHFHIGWEQDRLTQEVASPLGLDGDRASLAYLVLEPRVRHAAEPGKVATPADATSTPRRGRLIGDPMTVGGQKRGHPGDARSESRESKMRERHHAPRRPRSFEKARPAAGPGVRSGIYVCTEGAREIVPASRGVGRGDLVSLDRARIESILETWPRPAPAGARESESSKASEITETARERGDPRARKRSDPRAAKRRPARREKREGPG